MNISSAYTQSFSLSLTYTSLRMNVTQAGATQSAAPATPPVTTPPATDTVSVSPEAAAANADEDSVAQAPAPPPPSRAAQRAEALLAALDGDQDGTITKQEFTDGALALLRQAGARHHHRRAQGEHEDHGRREGHGAGRLENKLERLFDRVDGDDDGVVNEDELTAALAQVPRRGGPPQEGAEPPSSQSPSEAPIAASVTSVTVTIAIKQYAAVARGE